MADISQTFRLISQSLRLISQNLRLISQTTDLSAKLPIYQPNY
ncbi:hypothetical protein [Niallia circulans]|nr:hypothetical protein [Niallia circulans]